MIIVIYKVDSGNVVRSMNIPDFLKPSLTTEFDEAIVETDRMANDATEYIEDGVLTPKPIANQPS